MKLELAEWLPYFENRDIPSEEKEELIRLLWYAMKSGADQAFGRHPVQQSRGYLPPNNLQIPDIPLDSESKPISYCFGNAANDDDADEGRIHDCKEQG